jgi:hypothetical protein
MSILDFRALCFIRIIELNTAHLYFIIHRTKLMVTFYVSVCTEPHIIIKYSTVFSVTLFIEKLLFFLKQCSILYSIA